MIIITINVIVILLLLSSSLHFKDLGGHTGNNTNYLSCTRCSRHVIMHLAEVQVWHQCVCPICQRLSMFCSLPKPHHFIFVLHHCISDILTRNVSIFYSACASWTTSYVSRRVWKLSFTGSQPTRPANETRNEVYLERYESVYS